MKRRIEALRRRAQAPDAGQAGGGGLAAMITGNFEEHARSLSDEIRVAVLNLVAINSAVHLHSVIW